MSTRNFHLTKAELVAAIGEYIAAKHPELYGIEANLSIHIDGDTSECDVKAELADANV
jgi:hypothetical protein